MCARHAKSKGVKRASTRGTALSKRRNRWRNSGRPRELKLISADFHYSKERGPGHTAHRQKSQKRSYEDKGVRSPLGAMTPRLGYEQEVSDDRGSRNSWRVYQQPSEERGTVDSTLLLAPTPRRRAALRRPVPENLVDLLEARRTERCRIIGTLRTAEL